MACQIIQTWNFSTLVGAFLDLSIAFLLLLASALAFFASNFLSLFGLSLPCPCEGMFGNPRSNNNCLQRRLVVGPGENISGVHLQLKSKYPFDVMWGGSDRHCHAKRGFESGSESAGRFEFEGKSVDSLGHGRRRKCGLRGRPKGGSVDLVQSDCQEMVTPVDSRRSVFGGLERRRRKGRSVDYGEVFSDTVYDVFRSGARDVGTPPPSSISKAGNQGTDVPSSSDGMEDRRPERVSQLELNEYVSKTKWIETDGSSVENFGGNEHEKPVNDSNDKTVVQVLEQALDAEHTARTALYHELEKERSAAATAADEAMAMILRLQKEKAAIEMEARQYQRMIQEKSVYDAEEMNILKEILLRREREKHFLEKEVEYYRKMLFENDQVDDDMQYVTGAQNMSQLPSEELLLMLERTSGSNLEMSNFKMVKGTPDYGAPSSDSQNCLLDLGKELPVPDMDDGDSSKQMDTYEINHRFQEKEIVSVDERPVYHGKEVQVSSADGIELAEKINCHTVLELDLAGSNVEQGSRDLASSAANMEPHVHDVHVIDEKAESFIESSAEKSEKLLANGTLDISETRKSMIGLGTERRSCEVGSNTGNESSIMDGSQGKALPYDMRRNSMTAVDYERWKLGSNSLRGSSEKLPSASIMRRNSMSAVDSERFKLDNEIEWLRERLRIVQEGREKLKFSVGHREREKVQRKILEDIAGQLQEIRQLTEPGKVKRQAALPPPSSKMTGDSQFQVMSKKRRWRTLSLGVHRSQ